MKKINFQSMNDTLSRDEMKKIMAGSFGGGGSGRCTVRCDQDTSNIKEVVNCDRATVSAACNGDISNAVCICN